MYYSEYYDIQFCVFKKRATEKSRKGNKNAQFYTRRQENHIISQVKYVTAQGTNVIILIKK